MLLRRWHKFDPAETCTALFFFEEIPFVPNEEASRWFCENSGEKSIQENLFYEKTENPGFSSFYRGENFISLTLESAVSAVFTKNLIRYSFFSYINSWYVY